MGVKSERIRFTILGEGARDYYFVRAFLISTLGKSRTECYRSQTVPGIRSGEQQVRQLFPGELDAARRRPRNEQHWLVVITDGDRLSPDQRRAQLHEEGRRRGLSPMCSEDKLVAFIPCRNIESWFQWLETGKKIDETKNYKVRFTRAKPSRYGKLLSQKCRTVEVIEFPPSLQDACEQWTKTHLT